MRRSSENVAGSGSDAIEVYVRDLSQLFDSMDPSPFHEEALDDSAAEYIVEMPRNCRANHPRP